MLITGGAGGIGRVIARRFAHEGAAVVIADLLDDDAETVVRSIREAEGLAVYQRTDVTSFDQVEAAVRRALDDACPAPLWNQCFKTGGSQNLGRYTNPEFDELLGQINRETDFDKRKKLVNDAQDLLDQDPPWFVIGWSTTTRSGVAPPTSWRWTSGPCQNSVAWKRSGSPAEGTSQVAVSNVAHPGQIGLSRPRMARARLSCSWLSVKLPDSRSMKSVSGRGRGRGAC
ncbi:MAG: SDR family NAD(P)-dependent oxidoreductase [Chloroflexota bacterium]